jgi:hypothetical protein
MCALFLDGHVMMSSKTKGEPNQETIWSQSQEKAHHYGSPL